MTVTFAATSGGGSVNPTSAVSDATGHAQTTMTLGTALGAATFSASATGLTGVSAVEAGTPGAAANVVKLSGDVQSAVVGTAVANPLVAKVTDSFGNAVAGATVTWTVTAGGGTVSAGSNTTAADGSASVNLTLGTAAGANTVKASITGGANAVFTATGTAGAAAQIALNAGNSQTVNAGTAVGTPPSVIVKDANGNPVSGVSVTFAVASGGGSITGAAPTTNASGIATVGSWTLGATAGTNTLTATAAGLTGSPVTFTATGTVGSATQIALNAGNNQAASVGTAVATLPSVIVKDAAGNPVSGVSVTFAVAGGGGSITGAATTTNASGIATVGSWTLGALAGANTLTATSAGLTGSPVTFTATGTVGVPTQIAINAGNNQTAAVGSPVATLPSVIVKDAGGNPVSGVSVTFAVAGGGGSITGTAATTNASGIATVGSWTLGTTVGVNTLTATAVGLAGSPVTFSATGTIGGATQMAINAGGSQTATAGAAVGTLPSVIVKDAGGNPVSGVTVTFAVAGGGGSITGATPTTNASGIATVGSWTLGTTAGANTLTATSLGLAGSPVTFSATGTAGAAAQIAVSAGNGQTATAGTTVPTPPSVVVEDVNGNPVSGVSVRFAVAGGSGSINGATPSTSASGIAAVGSWTLSTTAGTNTLTATATGLTGSPVTFTATGTAGVATQIAINAGNNQTATAGTAVLVAPSVIVRDVNGNAVSGVSVTFAVATGGGSITGSTTTTNVSGIATLGSWTLGATPGANTLTATSTGLTGSPVTFSATGTVGVATQIAINAGNSQSATAGTAVTTAPSVIVKDANGNPVSGVSVTFAVATGGGSITGAAPTTNASGVATIGSWTLGTTAGSNTLTATSAGLTGSPVTFTATGTVGAAEQIAVNAGNNQTVTVGTAVPTQPSVIVKDVNGNPVSGVSVTFAVATGGGSITGATPTTNASGVATIGSWTLGTAAGANTLTAASAGLTGSPVTFAATGTASGASTITKVSGDAQTGTVATALGNAFVVKVADGFGNAIQGATVSWGVTTGSGSLSQTSNSTAFDGTASVTLTLGSTAGANSVTASMVGGANVVFNATGLAGAATQIAVNAGNSQSATAGTAVTTAPSAVVKDANGNPVSGVSVTFAVATGGGSITGATPTTNASGIATVGSWTLGTTAGANSLTATSIGLTGSPVTFSATGTAGAATQIAINAGNSQSATAGAAVSTPPSVIVKDANGNPVSGVGVTFAAATGGGTVTGATPTTNASGIATVGSWTLGTTAGTNTLTATSIGLTGSPVTFSATGTAGAPTSLTKISGDAQAGSPNTALPTAPSVRLVDVHGNGVPNTTVTFAVATGGGSITGGTQTTDATGLATVGSWALGASGAQSLTATAGALSTTFTATFSATGVPAVLVFSTAPSNATAGVAISPAIVVQAEDIFGALTPTFAGNVTLAIGTNPGGATLGGTPIVAATGGVATFNNISLNKTGSGYTLTASAGGLTGATSGTFQISAAAASVLTFTVQPPANSAVTDVPISPAVVVTAQDPYGNTATSFAGAVTMSLSTNPTGATLYGTLSATAAAGVASFGNLNVNLAGSGYVLGAAASGVSSATSSAFAVAQGAAVTNSWTNTAGGAWSTAANWSLGRVPGTTDSVVIAAAGAYSVTLDNTFSGKSVTVGAAGAAPTLLVSGQALTLTGTLAIQSGATLTASSATIGGTAHVNVAGTVNATATTVSSAVDIKSGGTVASAGLATFSGAFTLETGGTLQVIAAGATAVTSINSGVTNHGTIDLTSSGGAFSTALAAPLGIIDNQGTLTASAGTGGARGIAAPFSNEGTVTVNAALALSAVSANQANSGTINLVNGDFAVVETGSGSQFSNSGSISVGSGRTLTVSGGTLLQTSTGSITGAGSMILQTSATLSGTFSPATVTAASCTVSVPTSLTLGGSVTATGCTFNGAGTLTNAAGQTLTLNGSTVGNALTNQGTILASGTSSVTGALTTASTSIIRVGQVDASTSLASLTVSNGFTNNGTIELTTLYDNAYDAALTVSSGTLANAGTISAVAGLVSGGARTLNASLNNTGTVNVNVPLTLSLAGAQYTNATGGAINVNATLTLVQSGTSPLFTNSGGSLTIASGQSCLVTGGTFTYTSGTVSGSGALTLTNTTFNLNGSVSDAGFVLGLTNSTINGTGTLANVAGQTLTLNGSTINAPVSNAGILIASGTSAINGVPATSSGSTIRVEQIDGSVGTATLTVTVPVGAPSGFINNGTIELTNLYTQATNATLAVVNSSLNNAGTISVLNGQTAGGTRTINANVSNSGTITVIPNAIGTLAINGSLSLFGTSIVNMEVADAVNADQISVSGSLALGGTINVTVLNGYQVVCPARPFYWLVPSGQSPTGSFSTTNIASVLVGQGEDLIGGYGLQAGTNCGLPQPTPSSPSNTPSAPLSPLPSPSAVAVAPKPAYSERWR